MHKPLASNRPQTGSRIPQPPTRDADDCRGDRHHSPEDNTEVQAEKREGRSLGLAASSQQSGVAPATATDLPGSCTRRLTSRTEGRTQAWRSQGQPQNCSPFIGRAQRPRPAPMTDVNPGQM